MLDILDSDGSNCFDLFGIYLFIPMGLENAVNLLAVISIDYGWKG